MKFTVLATSLLALDHVYAITQEEYFRAISAIGNVRRALPNSPNGYTPTSLECPSTAPSVRSAGSLSPNETSWLPTRRRNAVASMRDLLVRLNITGFDAGAYIDQHANNLTSLPNVGLAFSGGGWRALMNGAGALAAFDSRTPNSTNRGQVGGLLQSATYVAGLSGGSWLVGSIYTNNFTTVSASTAPRSGVWQFQDSILSGPDTGGIGIFDTADYYTTIIRNVAGKIDAGYNASITDYWGRALSYQLINATDGGPAYTWSSIALTDSFRNGEQPLPITVADARDPGQVIISLNSTVYEFNPFEMGSWDSTLFGFMPTQYLGTNMTDGRVTQGRQCVVGFDNAGYVMGTSSSLFNQIILQANSTPGISPAALAVIQPILSALSSSENDIADYQPNPFYGWNPSTNDNAREDSLHLVDGGEDLQNIPLYPLIQPVRNVDTIFAVDSSADVNNWPNATALIATYERSVNPIANGTGFPYIPDHNTIVNLGLNTRPTFFGCNSSNVTRSTRNSVGVPLVVYLPNAPYSFFSNISTFSLETSLTDRNAIIQNGYNVATMANGTVDELWPTCLACAVLSRSMERTRTQVPQVCQNCFSHYCWNGTLDSRPAPNYLPTSRLNTTFTTEGGGGKPKNAAPGLLRAESWMVVTMASLVTAAFLI